jgi:CspA family cold shock protein
MPTGTVKWFADDKGFGFIAPDDRTSDLFVHHSGIEGAGYHTLAEGARVSFDAEPDAKGPRAVHVHLA